MLLLTYRCMLGIHSAGAGQRPDQEGEGFEQDTHRLNIWNLGTYMIDPSS